MRKPPAPPVVIDYGRAKQVFDTPLEWRKKGTPPYNKPAVQDPHNLPERLVWGSSEHAIFLFCVCYYMKGWINSETAIQRLGHLFESHPEFFEPDYFKNLVGREKKVVRAKLKSALKKHGLGFNVIETSLFWVNNLRKLARHWDGTSVTLFANVKDYDGLCKLIIRKTQKGNGGPAGFFGFQEKMVSMLIYFLSHAGMVKPMIYPVPVDFHILRVLVENEILTMENVKSGSVFGLGKLQRAAREVTLRYVIETGTEALDLADALWYLSRGFCRFNPGNHSTRGRYRGRATPFALKKFEWTKARERSFHLTCGRCLLQTTCRWNVPAASYYLAGDIVVRSERHKPPDLFV